MSSKDLHTLFQNGLSSMYYTEQRIAMALTKMADAAQSDDLRAAFETHLAETTDQIIRLERIFAMMDLPAIAQESAAIDGLLQEGDVVANLLRGTPALDAGLIAAAQAVEHHEIARYGTLVIWAQFLEMADAADLLSDSLDEEMTTDDTLSELADTSANALVMQDA